jgi:uncharacterized protein YciI
MPLYAVIGFDHPPHNMELRDKTRPAHRAFVLEHDQMIRFATAMLDGKGNQKGSIYFFEAERAEAIREWLKEEPFCTAGVYKDLHIAEISPAFNRIPRLDWPR